MPAHTFCYKDIIKIISFIWIINTIIIINIDLRIWEGPRNKMTDKTKHKSWNKTFNNTEPKIVAYK
jgi:hypothetical protein